VGIRTAFVPFDARLVARVVRAFSNGTYNLLAQTPFFTVGP
jgi:hypothetical protein